ncbi:uncharacterized protein LOC112343790, partial [Selaginella moellendorffii]|uniref:uncharacterized protein LOC112343790 n=1 Tax=Selaginella moellendorffii TaxID=88036 RepID=UPI000D1C3195
MWSQGHAHGPHSTTLPNAGVGAREATPRLSAAENPCTTPPPINTGEAPPTPPAKGHEHSHMRHCPGIPRREFRVWIADRVTPGRMLHVLATRAAEHRFLRPVGTGSPQELGSRSSTPAAREPPLPTHHPTGKKVPPLSGTTAFGYLSQSEFKLEREQEPSPNASLSKSPSTCSSLTSSPSPSRQEPAHALEVQQG